MLHDHEAYRSAIITTVTSDNVAADLELDRGEESWHHFVRRKEMFSAEQAVAESAHKSPLKKELEGNAKIQKVAVSSAYGTF